MTPERLVHHELCFGCGRANLFGLLMELERMEEGRVRGRGFIKQDHQGPVRGSAHPGLIAAALIEAMAFAAGSEVESSRFELRLKAAATVGAFLEVEAHSTAGEAEARAWCEGQEVASALGAYGRP